MYNRPDYTKKVLEALERNDLAGESELYIYTDGIRSENDLEEIRLVGNVREIIAGNWSFKRIQIIERATNWGLAKNIVSGVSEQLRIHDKVIVLEDDIITSVGFLTYMNEALNTYVDEQHVMHISAYMFPVKSKLPSTFFYNTASCWGWGTWRDRWKHFNPSAEELVQEIRDRSLQSKFDIEGTYPFFDHLKQNVEGKMNTWAVKWYASFFLKDGFALHPYPSLTDNIGHDGFGQNSSKNSKYRWDKLADRVEVKKTSLQESALARSAVKKFNSVGKNEVKRLNKFITKVIPGRILHKILHKRNQDYRSRFERENERKRLLDLPRYASGDTTLLGHPIVFLDGRSFLFMHDEIFTKEIYKFETNTRYPMIIDVGSNIGLSILFFKSIYPSSRVIGFEPDPTVFEKLATNIASRKLRDVEVKNIALWNERTELTFFSEGSDAGRIGNITEQGNSISVKTELLSDYLIEDIDLLKIDVEGAELNIVYEAKNKLHFVKRMFVEYHSFEGENQGLDKLLKIIVEAGFRYVIQHVGSVANSPLFEKKNYLGMDNQLNIFCFRVD